MFAGAAVAHRSKSHKSVMLSSAAAEYYEASEGLSRASVHPRYLEGLLRRRVPIHPDIHRQSGLHCNGQNARVFREAEAHSNSSLPFARVLLKQDGRKIPAKKWGDTEIAERGRSVLVMRARYRSAGLTPHQRGWTDAG